MGTKSPIKSQSYTTSRGELVFHSIIVLYSLGNLIRTAYNISIQYESAYADRYIGLKDGWLFGRSRDDSDIQWRELRGSLPLLAAAMFGFVLLSKMVQHVVPTARIHVSLLFSFVFIGVLHGAYSLHVMALLGLNFVIAQLMAGRKHGLLVVWVWNCGTLLLARLTSGIPFSSISPLLAFLDGHRGMLRWHISYNMLMLRGISFAADLHWTVSGRPPRCSLPAGTPPSSTLDLKSRVELPLPRHFYNLLTYLAYVLYPPLLISGPTITFNSFASQLAAPMVVPVLEVGTYAARWVGALLTLEGLTHLSYCNSAARFRLWQQDPPAAPLVPTCVGFWVLMFMWLKFLVVWRFARLWALVDGIIPPENMTRCMCNNYDIEGFWKNWHASYNQWLVRYMYIPLGGSRWRMLNVWVIFTFVAVWHDLELQLLGWAWLMCLFTVPELVAKQAAARPPLSSWMDTWAGRQLAAAAASVSMFLLMSVNLVGFVVGVDGILPLAGQVLREPIFAAAVGVSLFSAAHLMFAIRDREKANAAHRKD